MAHGKTLLEDDHTSNSDEEEDESLSLSDLPIKQQETTTTTIIINNNKPPSLEEEEAATPQQDFEFGSMGGTGGSLLTESELCAADDVFFQGQILPLRFSVSSDNGLSWKNPSRCGSRSESMEEHCTTTASSTGFTSLSSRSSSIKSDHQSSSSSSTTTTTTYYKPKLVKNNFHSHPSPKPQIVMKNSGSKSTRNNHVHRIGKSTTWGLFRVGLMRTPEIELQDLKLRNSNKSFSSSSSSSNGGSKRFEEKNNNNKKKKMQRFLFESCKCSVDAIESVSSRIVVVNKSSNGGGGGGVNKKKKSSSSTSEKKEIIKEGEVKEEEKEKEKEGKQKALNHRRTFEWLKELSIADVPTDEA